jgi:ABC-type polysaccharide/polyol phosphate transport system ATPase subunit
MATENPTQSPHPVPTVLSRPGEDTPIAIQVEDLYKSFRIPTQRVDSLKERAVRPFASRDFRELKALEGISFDIRQGEFFGIVGRNGSGKSTLLKLLASIYRADSGKIRMAGRMAPFIELGVGFNLELTARENVVLNGVMMGLTPQEAKGHLNAVIEFAELGEFVDLKLKNYSSGMLVRLAFSLMMEVDADILLIDEVLAVGDAAFQQKCADAFHDMKAAGKTIILVTHAMTTVEEYCDRAMLIDSGAIHYLGDPAEVGRRYLRLNFELGTDVGPHAEDAIGSGLRMLDAFLEGDDGERVGNLEYGQDIKIRVEFEAKEDLAAIDVGFILRNADGISFSQFGAIVGEENARSVKAGDRITVASDLFNPLVAGHYFIQCGVNRSHEGTSALFVADAINFVVFGGFGDRGLVTLSQKTTTDIKRDSGQ